MNTMGRHLLLFACVLVIGWPFDLKGAEYRVTPSLELRETYDDNIFFKDTSDWEHRLSPSITLDLRTERSQLGTTARLDVSEYSRHSEFDTTNQHYEVFAETMPSERYQLSFSGSYKDDYTFVDTLEESGIIADRSRRKRYTLEPGTAFSLSPRDSLRLFYIFRQIDYASDRYNDTEVNGAGLTWAHEMADERTTVLATVSASQVVFEGDDELFFLTESGGLVQRTEDVTQETLRLWLGLEHAWSETVDAALQVGGQYTESEFAEFHGLLVPGVGVYELERSYDSGFIVDGSLNWHSERTTLSLNVNRDVSESTLGENITRDRVRVGSGYRFSERWRGGFSAAYYQSETDGLVGNEDERRTYALNPSMSYRLAEEVSLSLGYRYTWTEDRDDDDRDERNRVFAQISMAWPISH